MKQLKKSNNELSGQPLSDFKVKEGPTMDNITLEDCCAMHDSGISAVIENGAITEIICE